jgi:hypothetical protein
MFVNMKRHLIIALVLAIVEQSQATLERRQASTITVDLSQIYQTIDGFGVSETFQRANQMESTLRASPSLSKDTHSICSGTVHPAQASPSSETASDPLQTQAVTTWSVYSPRI